MKISLTFSWISMSWIIGIPCTGREQRVQGEGISLTKYEFVQKHSFLTAIPV